MPTAVTEPPIALEPPSPPRKLWTREECRRLEEAGFLDYAHLELVEGELINRMAQNRPHSIGISVTFRWLVEIFGFPFVQQEAGIDIAPGDNPINEPIPDLIVLTRPLTEFPVENPGLKDLRLAVEIADTSLRFDLTVKAALYARALIPEYWVLDVRKRRVHVHRNPTEGYYHSVLVYEANEGIQPLAAPNVTFRLADVLPEL